MAKSTQFMLNIVGAMGFEWFAYIENIKNISVYSF